MSYDGVATQPTGMRVPEIAQYIGRTPRRVQQLIVGHCVVEPLPAEHVESRGRGYYVTDVRSFIAWLDVWACARQW